MDILSITNKESVSADAKVYTKDGNDFVTTTFDALYKNSSAKTNIEKSVSDANARIDTTNKTVAELDNYARAKGNGIVLQSQGEMVTANDSSDDYVVNLKPYGKSEQDSTTGKNLLDFNSLTKATISDVTFTPVYKNGLLQYINANGTASGNANYTTKVTLVQGTEYIASGVTNGSITTYCGFVQDTTYTQNVEMDNDINFVASYTEYIFTVSVRDGYTANNIKFYPMIRKADIEDSTYEPYTGGQPSPNPDYPQEIRSTVISEVRSCGAQLCDYSDFNSTNATWSIYGDTIKVTSAKAYSNTATYVKNPKSYIGKQITVAYETITTTNSSATGAVQVIIRHTDERRSYIQVLGKKSFIVPEDVVGVMIGVYAHNYATTLETENTTTVKGLMVNVGETALPWEEYQETVATLSNPITLYGIPTNSDGNFTDSNGQQWIADYIDVVKGKVVRCVNTEVFDGSENWYITNGDANFFHTIISKKALSNTKILCNIAQFEVIATYTEELGCLIVDSNNLRYRYEVNNNLTVDDVKQHLSQHNMIIYYPLATPTEEDLPTADVVALKNLKTFYSVTNVTNDSEVKGEMVLSYNADTKMYIDNKFAELATQLV